MDAWVETVAKRLGPPILTTSDEVRFNCWRRDCGADKSPDTKYHMYLNPVKGKWFCQRCQKGGSLDYLAKVLGLKSPEKSLDMWERIIHGFVFGSAKVDDEPEFVSWPSEYQPMLPGTQAHAYLSGRGISDTKISHYEIGFGIGELKNRIIFPDTDRDGRLVYWVARTYGKHHAKYKNATAPREQQVFNLGRILARGNLSRVVIVEGPISAIVSGYDTVATYGKYVTGEQITKLVKAGFDEYVIALDGDALLEGVSLATRLHRRGLNTRFVRFNYFDDPGSIGSRETRRKIHTAEKWDEWSAIKLMVTT